MAATLNILIGATLAAAQVNARAAAPAPTVTWAEEEFQPGVFAPDDAVDIIHWVDDQGTPQTSDDIPYVFMTGYQTAANGGTVFATYKYEARTLPGTQYLAHAFYPPISQVTSDERNRAVSLTLDNRTGEIYVTGQAGDPNAPTGLDYLTIKYDKDLNTPLIGWTAPSVYNGPGNGDDVPVDIDFVAGDAPGEGVVLVTGSSPNLPLNLDLDIATVGYNVGTGIQTTLWQDMGHGVGVRRYAGTGGGDDSAAGVIGRGILNVPSGEGTIEGMIELQAYVAGTAFESDAEGQLNNDIIALAYAKDLNTGATGVLLGLRLFDRVPGGNDVATGLATYRNGQGISTSSMGNYVTICGYTPSADPGAHANDTDYVVLNYSVTPNTVGQNWLTDGWSNGPARFFDGLASTEFSDDRALAIGRPTHFAFHDGYVWITGRVGEEDGTDYDIGTVVYDTFTFTGPVIDSWIVGISKRSGGSDDRAVAISVEGQGSVAYIGGWSRFGTPTLFVASKYQTLNASPIWTKIFRNTFGPDTGEGIVSVMDGPATPVFVTGGSTDASHGENQFTVRIDQP